jgi:mono/diheme cytochrome c family protein
MGIINRRFEKLIKVLPVVLLVSSMGIQAQDELADLSARGKELYFDRISCWICHGDDAEGKIGPSLLGGPSPVDIQDQLDANPQMAVIVTELNPDAEDLLALSAYIRELSGNPINANELAEWRTEITELLDARPKPVEFASTERDKLISQVSSFDTVLADWPRKAKLGSLKRNYETQVLQTFEPAEQVFFPEPGNLYFYENTTTTANMLDHDVTPTNTSQVIVGDATNREVITYSQMPEELRGGVHTTVLSPDGRYVYIIGGGSPLIPGPGAPRTPSTLLKVDALTLQPVKQVTIGGRLHHGQIFQDKYLLLDMFNSEQDGLDVLLYDPATDEVIGGIKGADLGGRNYTAYTDNEFIYILMQPAGANARDAAVCPRHRPILRRLLAGLC